jgi:structural maintenance of chromosome 1
VLYKLFHIEESIERNMREITSQNKALAGFRQEQRAHDAALDAARADQAKAKSAVMQKAKRIKKTEKAIEDKVRSAGVCLPLEHFSHIPTARRNRT